MQRTIPRPRRAPKYRNRKAVLDGHHFDSQLERDHYAILVLRVRAGEIADLEVHPRIPLHARTADGRSVRIGKMVPDFRYRLLATGETVVDDCKQPHTITALFQWKRKHLAAEHGQAVRVVMTAGE